MDKISDEEKEVTSSDTQEGKDCVLRVSTAPDLDEMMDIGTVDQVEQEAQMKEEEGLEISGSPAFPVTGTHSDEGCCRSLLVHHLPSASITFSGDGAK